LIESSSVWFLSPNPHVFKNFISLAAFQSAFKELAVPGWHEGLKGSILLLTLKNKYN